ncbi:MAG: hydrogenase iron-sulfur subunit [Deltaproteobacteria bacterium]|nr:hydrogenase iron-sulfur subunit [Deltaproteobacteria bacterium]
MKGKFEPLILAFCCNYCPSCSADLAKSAKLQYPPNIRIIKVPCIGAVGIIHILKALENGADGVCLMGCLEGKCEYSTGNFRAMKRVQYVKKLLGKLSIEKERLELYNFAAAEAYRFCKLAREVTETVRTLGPTPLKINNSKI